jgi:hypothetical protein
MSWIESGPVSVPPKSTVTFIAAVLIAAALAGAGYGLHAVWRAGGPASAGSGDQGQDAQAVSARPLVELPPAVAPPPPAANTAAASNAAAAADDESDAEANTIAQKTAAAQAVQSKPAQQPGDIDQILTSPSEKPQPPAKPSTDEGAPGAPTKNDVPF